MSSVLAVPLEEKTGAARVVFHTDAGDIEVPPSVFTLSGFRSWALSDACPEGGKVCFLAGEVDIDMSPEELSAHGQVKLEVSTVLGGHIKKRKLGFLFPDRSLLTNEEAGLSTEPDACFATRETIQSGRLQLVPLVNDEERSKELTGTPDWVLEIVSDGSVRKDTRRLRELYFRAGIPEYWLIDARGGEIDFQILIRGAIGYENSPTSRNGWQTSMVFNRRFRLTRLPDIGNLWVYTLQMKSVTGRA